MAAARVAHLELDLLRVELARAQALAEGFARARARIGAGQRVEHTIFGTRFGLRLDVAPTALAHLPDADFHEIAHDLLHIAADIAHFRELGRLDLDERSLGELGKPARNLGLADARGADHQNILGQDFFPEFCRKLLPAPAVAQRDRDRALGVMLAHDIAIEFGNDFARREKTGHAMLSTTILSLV